MDVYTNNYDNYTNVKYLFLSTLNNVVLHTCEFWYVPPLPPLFWNITVLWSNTTQIVITHKKKVASTNFLKGPTKKRGGGGGYISKFTGMQNYIIQGRQK
jgi:hypothetical protein